MTRNRTLLKITALLICIALAFGCTSFSAYAAEENGTAQSTWELSVPQIRITTAQGNGVTLQKEDDYQDASITITGTDGSVLTDNCTVKVRGNTTALSWVEKKSYNFKFAKKKDVLGMGKGKKWALVANTFDPTLLRNITAFGIARELNIPYTSEYRVVELWMDNSFRGCYLLFEPVQEGTDRVNINIDNGKDFLMEYEARREEEDKTYFTVENLRFLISEPEEPDDEELEYIQTTMESVISAMKNGSREDIEAVVDIDSFAKFYLLNEYMKTYDLDMSSVYFYFKDGKLYAGPPWDYDLSSGNAAPDTYYRASATLSPQDAFVDTRIIYKVLCKNTWFYERVRAVYREHYTFMSQIAADGGFLDTMRTQYTDVINRNYGEAGWRVSRHWINIQRIPESTYGKNYTYLKDWCAARNEWMTEYYRPLDDAFIYGDANGDGVININDVTEMQRVLAEFEVGKAPEVRFRTDFFSIGYTISNATALQRHLGEIAPIPYLGETRFYQTLK